ncbi:MAG TPA: hypothetical protein VEQ34_00540, partial [Pyrinomonadaceae bacterium]|nr:hypothetical protein [Pyrinomonadaceae bacterium]
GEGGKMISLMGNLAPRLTDKAMEWSAAATQQKASPDTGNRPDSLYETHSDLRERGNYDGIVFEESLYQRAKLNPLVTSAILIGGAAAFAALVANKSNRERNRDEVNHRNLQNEQPRSLEVGHS